MTTDYFRIERWVAAASAPTERRLTTPTADCMHWQPPGQRRRDARCGFGCLTDGRAARSSAVHPQLRAAFGAAGADRQRLRGRCLSVCCSEQCMLAELTDARDGAPHTRRTPSFQAAHTTRCKYYLPTDPQWLRHCMDHGGSVADECAILRRCGCHTPPYTLFCRCDGEENLTVLPPAEFSLARPP